MLVRRGRLGAYCATSTHHNRHVLSLDDPRWPSLEGGYRIPYDPRAALRTLSENWESEAAWKELWNELHHQGDVGTASYAALTVLATLARSAPNRDWNVYALAATIETQRHALANPPLPSWLEEDYRTSLATLAGLAVADLRTTRDPILIQSTLGVVALERGAVKLGAMIGFLDDSELDEYLDEHLAWAERYRQLDR